MAHQLVLAKTGDAICNTETANPIALATPANPDNDSSIPNHTSRKTSSEQSSRARQSWQVVVNLNSETTKPSSRRLSAVSPKTPNRRPGSPSVTSESSSPDRTNLVRSSQSSSTRGLTQSQRVAVNLQSLETPNRRSERLSAAASYFSTPNHTESVPTRSSPSSSRRGSTQSQRVAVNLQSPETPNRRPRFAIGEFSNQLCTGSSQSLLPNRSFVERHMFVSNQPNSKISKRCPQNSLASNTVSSPKPTGTAGSSHRLSSKQSSKHSQKVLVNLQSPVLLDRRVHASDPYNCLAAVKTPRIPTSREETSISGLCTQLIIHGP